MHPELDARALDTVRGGFTEVFTEADFYAGLKRAATKRLWKPWTWLIPTGRELAHRLQSAKPDKVKTFL